MNKIRERWKETRKQTFGGREGTGRRGKEIERIKVCFIPALIPPDEHCYSVCKHMPRKGAENLDCQRVAFLHQPKTHHLQGYSRHQTRCRVRRRAGVTPAAPGPLRCPATPSPQPAGGQSPACRSAAPASRVRTSPIHPHPSRSLPQRCCPCLPAPLPGMPPELTNTHLPSNTPKSRAQVDALCCVAPSKDKRGRRGMKEEKSQGKESGISANKKPVLGHSPGSSLRGKLPHPRTSKQFRERQ